MAQANQPGAQDLTCRPPVLAEIAFQKHKGSLEPLSLADRFRKIHDINMWGAPSSRSGPGSELSATALMSGEFLELVKRLGVRTLIDAPCGDGQWIGNLELPLDVYIGLDIVPELIAQLNAANTRTHRTFRIADLTRDAVPSGDLILCRDCLVHLSFGNIKKAINQFRRSGSRWLLTTHFERIEANRDVEDGDWRALNFCKAPFNWPHPVEIINERCLEMDGAYSDKTLALWEISELI